ncbi:MAG: hypothetical protein JNJ58_05145 [Chitinophagaceae bacterium]|nr:hypothetical protein [Chitinophagaceae bacterium]
MNKIKYYGFILLLSILCHHTNAQTEVNGLRKAHQQTKIALSDILGKWYTGDSVKSEIEFVKLGYGYVQIEGIKHGVGNYGFILDRDSLYVNGTAPNWPPYDCTLYLINQNVLEIKFYQFFDKGTINVTYRRR